MEINFENIETICRICLQSGRQSSNEIGYNLLNCEFLSMHSKITIDSRFISLVDVITMCLSHKLSDDKDISQMICNLCVRRLTDCYELKYQIEQSEQFLLNVVSNRLFMSLNTEYSESSDLNLSKTNPIINDTLSSANDFEASHVDYGIQTPKAVTNTTSDDVLKTANIEEEPLPSKSTVDCLICSKKFTKLSKLDRHLIKQHPVRNDLNVSKPHHCDECPKSYTTKANLVLHMAVHTGIKPFICEICGRGFYKKTSLSTHMSIHTGIRKHLCVTCGRSFTSANILQQHKRTHSDVRRYTCSVCSKGFHTSNDLRVHFRSHSGEKPFLCSNCGRRFARVTHLNIHLRTHSGERPYMCLQCPKAFAQSGDLKAHERIHNGEKPYPCRICDKRFNQSSGLASHMKSHTNERNYICFCGKSFTQSSSLARHGKLHLKIQQID